MLIALLLGVLTAAQSGSAGAGQARMIAAPITPAEIRIVMASSVYQPDGGVRTETATLANTSTSVVHMYSRASLCDMTMTGAAEPGDAGFGWRVAAQVVTRTASGVVVSLDWRRLWDHGRKLADGPSGTLQLTMHPGDRIPLDLIPNTAVSDVCRATGMELEVQVARPPARGGASGAVASITPIGATPGGLGVFDADIWLLHTQASGTEQDAHATVRLTQTGGTFAFPPVTFTTSKGQISMALSGTFRRFRTPTGVEYLEVSMARVLTGGTAPPDGLSGTSTSLTVLPGPGEVVSFEMMGEMMGRAALAASGAVVARTPTGSGGGAGGGGGIGGFSSAGAGAGTGANAVASSGSAQVPRQSGGGGGFGGGGGATATTAAGQLQAFTLLDGHTFSLRLRLTAVVER